MDETATQRTAMKRKWLGRVSDFPCPPPDIIISSPDFLPFSSFLHLSFIAVFLWLTFILLHFHTLFNYRLSLNHFSSPPDCLSLIHRLVCSAWGYTEHSHFPCVPADRIHLSDSSSHFPFILFFVSFSFFEIYFALFFAPAPA